jgi:hypothetical protein
LTVRERDWNLVPWWDWYFCLALPLVFVPVALAFRNLAKTPLFVRTKFSLLLAIVGGLGFAGLVLFWYWRIIEPNIRVPRIFP